MGVPEERFHCHQDCEYGCSSECFLLAKTAWWTQSLQVWKAWIGINPEWTAGNDRQWDSILDTVWRLNIPLNGWCTFQWHDDYITLFWRLWLVLFYPLFTLFRVHNLHNRKKQVGLFNLFILFIVNNCINWIMNNVNKRADNKCYRWFL